MTSFTTCPACNYTRLPTDIAPDWECPKCQKVYAKITRDFLLHDLAEQTPLSEPRLSSQFDSTFNDSNRKYPEQAVTLTSTKETGMDRPVLKPTTAQNETFAGITYHLDGELVPVLTVELTPGQSVYFEHHILLWKNPAVTVEIKPIKGALKRMMAGMQIFITEAGGQIAFSRDGVGHIFAMHLSQGQELHIREYQFIAATQNIDYTFERVKGVSNMLFGGTGFFIDKFRSLQGDGILWLHGYGNVFEIVLGPHEQIDIEPGGWLYKDPTVRMETNFQKLSVGLLSGFYLAMNRFTGPGRVGIQSMYLNMPSTE